MRVKMVVVKDNAPKVNAILGRNNCKMCVTNIGAFCFTVSSEL